MRVSKLAFAAVAYLRFEEENKVDISMVIAKTRVAPIKPMSIPRKELQAAVLGSRLYTLISEKLEYPLNQVFFWSDSKTVLYWIKSDKRKYKPFVAHRIGEILESTETSDWNWVPTEKNVADYATRDTCATKPFENTAWKNGPQFLKLTEDRWPKEIIEDYYRPCDDEIVTEEVHCVYTIHSILAQDSRQTPTWTSILRKTAWILRFLGNCKNHSVHERNLKKELIPSELKAAEIAIIRTAQHEAFGNDYDILVAQKENPTSTKRLSENSRLKSLSPELDKFDVLRINGRTKKSEELSFWTKNPAILDPKHPITILLIEHMHNMVNQNGQETVVNLLRQKYHILGVRTAVRRVWSNCFKCKLARTMPKCPLMGELPLCRVTKQKRAFMETGVDYFGPMNVAIGRRHEKRYGVLFTCMATRAIHLEISTSLNTDSAIMAIRRFVSRRGYPNKIYSDNGTNFRGADKELRLAIKDIDQSKVTKEMTNVGIEWHFNPPSAPHMGGSWERMVKSVKTSIKAVLKEQVPREETLQTIFAEVENIINNHPLTHVSTDPNDPESLTPNHFLIGSAGNVPIPGTFTDEEFSLRKQWRKAQRMADQFWKRWVNEYLSTLTRRTKWHTNSKSIELGDLVLIADGNLPRNCWPKGVVVKVYPGTDGIIRAADVKTALGVLKRPSLKLCIIHSTNSAHQN